MEDALIDALVHQHCDGRKQVWAGASGLFRAHHKDAGFVRKLCGEFMEKSDSGRGDFLPDAAGIANPCRWHQHGEPHECYLRKNTR